MSMMSKMSAELANHTERVICDGRGLTVGEGQSAVVIRYEALPGDVFKLPHTGRSEDREALFLEQGRHAVLSVLGINTLDRYEVVELVTLEGGSESGVLCGRMPDLTRGGKRYVFSVQDAFRYAREYLIPYPIDMRPEGAVVNGPEFLDQLARQMGIAAAARVSINGAPIDGIKIETPGMFLIVDQVDPGKVCLETIIADFHDGQTFDTATRPEPKFDPTQPEYYESAQVYLTWVTRFYPELSIKADAFLSELSSGQCSLN